MNAPTPEKAKLPPQAVLVQMTFGFILSQALSVAAKLHIADLLAERAKTAEELAEETGSDPRGLFRLLRALAKADVFTRDEKGRFSNTELSEFLRSDHPDSMRAVVHMMGDEEHWRAQGKLDHAVRTGESGFVRVFGKSPFPYLMENPEKAKLFDEAMTCLSKSLGAAAVGAYDFSEVETVADIGGGHGILLGSVLELNPDLKGILFDQPQVVSGSELLSNEEVADRVEIIGGSFFEEVPVNADVYLMKHIIHDWNDEESVLILSNLARAAKPGAKLVLLESVVEDEDVPSLSGLMDLNMLAVTSGRERTAAEYADLMERSGFRFVGVHETPSPLQLIEGERVLE